MKINNRIAKFYRVSFNQFLADYCKILGLDKYDTDTVILAREVWSNITLPNRKTKGSAGYDFHSTLNFSLEPNKTVLIPTGIRVEMDEDWFLQIVPRSGLGFKYRTQLDNTLGVIDSDYSFSDNEGHIMIKITNDSKTLKVLNVDEGDSIAQGIFIPYGITIDDKTEGERNGGFGSTGK